MNPCPSETVVVGVGNAILSGDGIGVHAARVLRRDGRLPAGVAVLQGGTLGLELVGFLVEARHVLFLDAAPGGSPGTVVRIPGDELLDIANERTVHQVGILDLIGALIMVSAKNPEIAVLGMKPPNYDWSKQSLRAVRAATAPLVDAAFEQLRAWRSASGRPPAHSRSFRIIARNAR